MARVLITGGMGFIGSHLSHSLTSHDHQVLAYGTIQHYQPPTPTFLENITYRLSHLLTGTEIVRGSTLDLLSLQSAIQQFSPTHLVHLAALPLASAALHHTDEAFDSILRGLFNVLELLKHTDTHLIYISSSMVYGDFAQTPMPESGPTSPKEIYGTLKLMGELLVRAYSLRFSIPSTIIRPSAVYGPADINYRVIQIFIESATQGRPITVNSDASLDFTYVEDTAQGIEKALAPSAIDHTFNITYGQGRTLIDAAVILRRYFSDLIVLQGEEPAYIPKRGTLDNTLARNILGYSPTYSLEDGIDAYITYIHSYNRSLHGSCRGHCNLREL